MYCFMSMYIEQVKSSVRHIPISMNYHYKVTDTGYIDMSYGCQSSTLTLLYIYLVCI